MLAVTLLLIKTSPRFSHPFSSALPSDAHEANKGHAARRNRDRGRHRCARRCCNGSIKHSSSSHIHCETCLSGPAMSEGIASSDRRFQEASLSGEITVKALAQISLPLNQSVCSDE
jgi:hypothetical protein